VVQTLDQVRDRLVKILDPESIILFGSRARDEGDAASDYDLLIVQHTSKRPIDRRVAAEYALADRGVALDIFVYTPGEVLDLHALGSPFIEEVLETGRVLYMRKATEQWLRDCDDELSSAQVLLEHGKYRAACFHGQQSVEKCLKSLIIEKGEKPQKTHDLLELRTAVERLGWRPGLDIDDTVFLNSIYKGRYPSEEGLLPHGEPTDQDARRAVECAARVCRATREALA
jgi:HEPN domain-containing protein/predicted nucleotidyltransferase